MAQRTFLYVECGRCRGSGTVEILVGTPPNTHMEEVTCPICNGTKTVKFGEIIKEG